MKATLQQLIRIVGLKILKATAHDIEIKHHWVQGQRLKLHSFKHKGYWWHGKNRETNSIMSVAKLLHSGQVAFDIGAHIGYFTTYFASLVGREGKVIAFEPSDENLVYTRYNVHNLPQVKIDTRGISNHPGEVSFFVESLTGQNNSLVKDYQVFEDNAAHAGFSCERREVKIQVTTVDDVCREISASPAFIKMDIEGAELDGLLGMEHTIRSARPAIMIEISRQHHECWRWFNDHGYKAYDDQLVEVSPENFAADRPWPAPINFFFLPK